MDTRYKLENKIACRSRNFHTLGAGTKIVKSTYIITVKVVNKMIPKIILQLKFDTWKGIG